MINKQVVLEIIDYQSVHCSSSIYDNQDVRIREYTNSMPDEFEYEPYMNHVVENFTCHKMVPSANAFLTPFQLRMRKYKKGKDWKLI